MDFVARKADRTEIRQFSERLFGEYVRQAPINRRNRMSLPPPADKPALKALPVGKVADGIALTEGGEVELSNGVRQEWLKEFGGNEQLLKMSLIKAASRIRTNTTTAIGMQILGSMAEDCKDMVLREKNAVKAAAARLPSVRATPDGKVETTAERWRRLGIETDGQKSNGGTR
jgi:hypothetical protein